MVIYAKNLSLQRITKKSKNTGKFQQPFILIVDQILSLKKAGKDTTYLENQIDIMVYKLYGLTYDEVKIIDPGFDKVLESFGLSKEDFARISV